MKNKNKLNFKYLEVFEKNYAVILELSNNFSELSKLNIEETTKMIDLLHLYKDDSLKYLQDIEEILNKFKDINDEKIMNENIFITCMKIQKKTNYLMTLLLNKLNVHMDKINPNSENIEKIIEDMIMQSRFNTIEIINENPGVGTSGF
jgi:hypothetical protein